MESSNVKLLIELLRSTSKNEEIFAEECALYDPSAIQAFCTKFLAEKDQRLDIIVFAHEYGLTSGIGTQSAKEALEKQKHTSSLATFLLTTLLLPSLLVAPEERDIRIVNVCNPFYAAAIPSFEPKSLEPIGASVFISEGMRSLASIILFRHVSHNFLSFHIVADHCDIAAKSVGCSSNKSSSNYRISLQYCPTG